MRVYRNQLLPKLKCQRDLSKHPYSRKFKAAAKDKINSCKNKGCFKKTTKRAVDVNAKGGAKILLLMQVFSYKFNKNSFLYKFKALIVVRGNLQIVQGDTYAATLAAQVFRFLIALAALFRLIAFQYNVLNTFLNTKLNYYIYVRTLKGFST